VVGGFQYRAFLSYSHRDRRWAGWLHRALEGYRVPARLSHGLEGQPAFPKRLAPIFRDRDELPTAPSLSSAIQDALNSSEALIVICSPNAATSRWVDEEIRAFRRLGRGDRIFCLIVDGVPNAGDERECFPPSLRIDESGAALDPVAADVRTEADGRTGAKLKLIAGLLGVGLDELRQRDLQRRYRQLAAVTAGAFVVTAATVSLAILALLARAEADRRRAQAEDLIGFMLGDLPDRLQQIGRLDLFSAVADKAMEYFAAMKSEDVTDSALAQRAKALRRIGETRMDQGNLASALDAFRESLSLATQLVARDMRNPDWQIAVANAHFWVGSVNWQRGDLAAARTEFETVLPIVDGVSAREPDRVDWLSERGFAYTNLGRVLEAQGHLAEALAAYQQVLSIDERLVKLEPGKPDWRLEVGFANNNIGKLVSALGRLREARTRYAADLAIKQSLFDTNARHNRWREYLATSEAFMGRISWALGDDAAARAHFTNALAHIRRLVELDPANTPWLRNQWIYQCDLARVLRVAGDSKTAEQLIAGSLSGLEALLATEPSNATWQRDLAVSRIEAAYIGRARRRPAEAATQIQLARGGLGALVEREPADKETRIQLAAAGLLAGDLAAARGEAASARQEWTEVVGSLDRYFSDSSDPVVLDARAGALMRLGRLEEAASISRRLQDMGYRDGGSRDAPDRQ
jgi:tetratricopeptide (TPR) repeat protein